MAAYIELSPKEREMLLHRLSVSDCIADALSEMYADRQAVEDAAERLALALERGMALDQDQLTDLDLDVLADAVDGSTWAVCLGEDAPAAERAAANRVLRSAAYKVFQAGGSVGALPLV